MSQFLDLPLELLPVILSQLVSPHHLALCCLVNKTFFSFTIPQLYERVYVSAWHRQGKAKVNDFSRVTNEHDIYVAPGNGTIQNSFHTPRTRKMGEEVR